MTEMRRSLYAEIEPYDAGFLQVSALHRIYYEQCGNPQGKPVVFLHGGPGAGCNPKSRRFFDPKRAHPDDLFGRLRDRGFSDDELAALRELLEAAA